MERICHFFFFFHRDKIPRCKRRACSKNLPVIFSSLSEEYLGRLCREFPNADASSFAGRARNSCEFAEKDNTGEHLHTLLPLETKSFTTVP